MRTPTKSARTTAVILAVALAAFAAFHGYWAVGGTWGLSAVVGGRDAHQPSRTGMWGMMLVLTWCAICALIRVNHGGAQVRRLMLPARITLWLFALGALAAAIANVFSGTTPFEQRTLGPLLLVTALLSFWTALGGLRPETDGPPNLVP